MFKNNVYSVIAGYNRVSVYLMDKSVCFSIRIITNLSTWISFIERNMLQCPTMIVGSQIIF